MPQVIVQEFFCDKCGSVLSVKAEYTAEDRQRFLVNPCDYCYGKQHDAIDHAVTLIAALVKRGRTLEEIDDAVSEFFHRPEPTEEDSAE